MIDLLLIHANWCGHCQHLMPEWKKMKEILKDNENVSVHEIENDDSDKEHRLSKFSQKNGGNKVSVRGFPTIIRFENGEMTEFKGKRTAEELAKWALKHKLSGGRRKTKRTKRRRPKTCKKCSFNFW
uniref:Thioredoxin domain-containing protein n=1 Tax=viral metagenome TaxID=1070528 RepID=A0A6C0B8I3_9ZZZZ